MTAYVFKRKATAENRKKVIDTATAGTYTFVAPNDTIAKITLVGGGGGAGAQNDRVGYGGGGGSGACVQCSIKLAAGTYTITNGAGGSGRGLNTGAAGGNGGNSAILLGDKVIVSAGGGIGGRPGSGAGGDGGVYTFAEDTEIVETTFLSNGNKGDAGAYRDVGYGAGSVYGGYGSGGSSDITPTRPGKSGYIFVEIGEIINADKCYVFKRKRPKEYRKKVIDTATAGIYTFDVAKDTTARIILVGGGGAGGQVWEGHSEGGGGGSGACVFCVAKLTAGTYTITNGAAAGSLSGNGGSSTLSLNGSTLITAGGGYGGQGGNGVPGNGGTYTISDSLEIEKEIIVSNGNTGGRGGNMVSGAGGASVYKGYGRGGASRGTGTSGYIWVELTTDETDYDYKIDNDACYVLKRKHYWKYEYQDWTQPVLTSNTSDSSFVVSASSELEAGLAAWKSFDGVIDSNCWISTNVTISEGAPQYYYITTDTPLKISSISVTNRTGNYPHPVTKGILQASVNGNEWFDIVSIDNDVVSAGSTWTIVANETTGYKYHRIKITEYYLGSDNTQYVALGHLVVDAQKAIAFKATKDDYDFTTD